MRFLHLTFFFCISTLFFARGVSDVADAQEQNVRDGKRLSISQTMDALSKINVKRFDSDIPPAVRPLLTDLKHELLDLISGTINDPSFHWKSQDDLKMAIISKMKEAGVNLPEKNKAEDEMPEYSYNEIQGITIERPPHHDNLIVATTTLWVMCGQDTSFYIFRKEGGKWRLLLAEEARDYNDITGAHSWFGYSISPPDKNGSFFVVTANVNPWCSSNWQQLRYNVYRPGRLPDSPIVLLSKSDTIYLGVDPPVYKITTEPDKFTLMFNGDWYWNPDTDASPQYATYNVTQNKTKLLKKGRLRAL